MKPLEIFCIYTNRIKTAIICSFVSQEKGNKRSKNVIDMLKEMSTKTKSKASSLK